MVVNFSSVWKVSRNSHVRESIQDYVTQMYESLQLTSKAQTEPLCFYKYISRHIALFSSHQVNGGFPLI